MVEGKCLRWNQAYIWKLHSVAKPLERFHLKSFVNTFKLQRILRSFQTNNSASEVWLPNASHRLRVSQLRRRTAIMAGKGQGYLRQQTQHPAQQTNSRRMIPNMTRSC